MFTEVRNDIWSPEAGVIGDRELSSGLRETNQGPLQEQ